MKNIILSILTICLFSCSNYSQTFKSGDIIFQTSKSAQSDMLKKVTGSNLTHCGIIFYKKNKPFVFEAVQPVKITPLDEWIRRGKNSNYCVTRLKNNLSENDKKIMYKYASNQLGKNYDSKFQWSDNKMYCSELVWKIYKSAGYTLTDTKVFSDYNLSDKSAKIAIKNRYHGSINLNETVVSPIDLYNSNMSKVVYSNY